MTDPFGGFWYAPRVFHLWREAVEGGVMQDISLDDTHLAIVHEGPFFSLAMSKCRQSYHDVLHPISFNPDNL